MDKPLSTPSIKSVLHVAKTVEVEQLQESLDDVLRLIDDGLAVRVGGESNPKARIDRSTVYKLYQYAPELRDVIVARYPDCVAQELADQKQEAKDLRAYVPQQVSTKADKTETRSKPAPDAWVVVQEVEGEVRDEGEGDAQTGA